MLLAQSNAEVTEDLRATLQANGQGILLQWWGNAGRTYFVQTSPTLNLGVDWSYEGHVLTGTGVLLSVSLPAQPSPSFIRLRYTNQPVTGDPYEADPDQDGLSNREEIQTHGTNPLDPDSDDDGMPDGWEHRHGLDFNDARDADLVLDPALTQAQRAELMDIKQAGVVMSYPEDYAASWAWSQLQWEWMSRIDPDHDGWTNLEEFLSGTDPRVADTTYLRVRRGGVQSATAGQGLTEPFVVQAIREVMGAGGMRTGFTALADEEVTFSGPADMLFIPEGDEPSPGANPLTLKTDDAGYVHVRAQAPSQAGRHTIFVRLGSGREAALSLEVQPPEMGGVPGGGGPGTGPGSPQPNPEFTLQWQHVWRSASVQGSNSTGGFSNHRTHQKAAAPGVQPQRAGAEAGYPSMSSPAGHYGHNDSDFAQRDPQMVETWRILYDPAWREYWSSDFGTTYVQDWHKSAPPLIAESILAIPFESFSTLLWTQAREEHVFGLSRSRVGPWIEGEENGETVRGCEITASTTQYRARLVAMKDGQPVVLPQGTTLALPVMETVTQFDTETGAGVATETRIRKTLQMVIPPGASTSTPIETGDLMSPAAPNTEKLLRLLPIDIKWEAKPVFANVDDNPDPWTNKTNGKRIMVGAPENDHGGDMRRELNVKVSIPGYANQPVYLKVFDVDDPSTVSDPGDKLDPNDDTGDDNMHAVGLGDNWGHFIPQAAKLITVTLNSSGETTATFKVNQQPGNNYRVAVAIKDGDLNVLQVTNPGGQGFVTPDDKSVSGFNGAVSPMLTVWRKLHIEVDSMEAVTNPKDSPDRVDAVGDHWATDTSGLQNRQRLYLAGSLPEGSNFYERGRLKAGGAEYMIVESGSDWVTLSTSVQSVPPGFIGPVEIYDDDDRGLAGPPLPKPSLITQGVKDIFKRAYIAIEERTQNPTKTIPFKLYTSVTHPLLADSSLNNAIDTNGDDWGGFWNHYVISSYQPQMSEANDPSGDVVEGATMPPGYGPRYSVIFVETIRDATAGILDLDDVEFKTRLDEIVAHEIGHGPNDPGGIFAGSHPESGLMGEGAPQHDFSAESLRRLRQVYRWQEP